MEWIMIQVNTVGEAFVRLTLPMLLTSTVLIGVVLLVASVLRGRIRAGLRYWLVTCVLAYLVFIPLLSLNPPSTHWPTGGGSPIAILRLREPQTAYADPTSSTPARHTHAPLSQPATGQTGFLPATEGTTESSQTTLGEVGERPRNFSWQGGCLPALVGRRRRRGRRPARSGHGRPQTPRLRARRK